MPKRLFYIVTTFAILMACSGCFGIYTMPPQHGGGENAPKGSGLGPEANPLIWKDGKSGKELEPFAIQSDTYVELAKKVNPAVVNIFTSQKLATGIGIGLFSIPLPNADYRAQSLGTGFLISEDGFLLTNYHVIARADEISVFLQDTNEVQSTRIIGVDPLTDVALLKIETNRKLPYLPLADSDNVLIGEPVIAVGNPFGLSHSLTTGVISAKNRILSPGTRRGNFEDYIQTSALINPGNSGGPLLNLYGEVVGINTAMIAKAQGIGFAIPSNMVKDLASDLVRKGFVERGYFGIAVVDLTPVLAERFKMSQKKGVMIARIDSEGPAAQSGLQKGDIIRNLDGKAVKNAHDCARIISLFGPGQRVSVDIDRQGQSRGFIVTTDAL